MVCRITTEIPSKTPLKNNKITDNQKFLDNPKPIIHKPKKKTAVKSKSLTAAALQPVKKTATKAVAAQKKSKLEAAKKENAQKINLEK